MGTLAFVHVLIPLPLRNDRDHEEETGRNERRNDHGGEAGGKLLKRIISMHENGHTECNIAK